MERGFPRLMFVGSGILGTEISQPVSRTLDHESLDLIFLILRNLREDDSGMVEIVAHCQQGKGFGSSDFA